MTGRDHAPGIGHDRRPALGGQRRHGPALAGDPAPGDQRRPAGSCSSPASPTGPGSLARLLTCIGQSGANLVTVAHLREGYDLHVRETAVHIVLETRGREHAHAVLEAVRSEGLRRPSRQPLGQGADGRRLRRRELISTANELC